MILQAMTVLKQQQTGFINGFGQDMGWRIAWVVLWKSDKKRIFEKHFAVHITTGEGKGEKDAIDMPLTKGFDSRVAGFCAQVQFEERKRVVEGKSVSVRVDLGCRRIIKKK